MKLTDEYGTTDLGFGLCLVAIVAAFAAFVFMVCASSDTDEWTQLDGGCWLHTTQNDHAFTPDAPTVRQTFCPVSR